MTQTDPRRPLNCVGQDIIIACHLSSPLTGALRYLGSCAPGHAPQFTLLENLRRGRPPKERAFWRGSLRSRIETRAEEVGRPFRLGLQSCLIDRRQDFGWQGTFGQRREIVP